MKTYFAIVDHQEGSAYGIRFPDFPDVFSGADEIDAIVPNAIEALQLWAEDMPTPEPSTHAQIIGRDDMRAELAGGAWLIAVPFIENDTAVVRANVTFERGMLRAIDAEAKARGLTRAAFLANAARHEIQRG